MWNENINKQCVSCISELLNNCEKFAKSVVYFTAKVLQSRPTLYNWPRSINDSSTFQGIGLPREMGFGHLDIWPPFTTKVTPMQKKLPKHHVIRRLWPAKVGIEFTAEQILRMSCLWSLQRVCVLFTNVDCVHDTASAFSSEYSKKLWILQNNDLLIVSFCARWR